MSGNDTTTFPLQSVSDSQLHQLYETIWGSMGLPMQQQRQQQQQQPCAAQSSLQPRLTKLDPFFRHYREMTASYVSEAFPPHETAALRSHEDLFSVIRLIKTKPNVKRNDLTTEYFSSRNDDGDTVVEDEQRAFNIAIRVMLMVSCSFEGQVGGLLELGTEPSIWRRDQSLQEFVSTTFPVRDHPSLNEEDEALPDIKSALRATRLKKITHLSFQGTDDLRNHLRLDQKTGVVEVYHHTTVLKEYLRASKDDDSRKMSDLLPRQLALETLDSLQKILFPLDRDSRALLRSLVSKQSLDPDCLSLGYPSYRHDHERNITYHYWGSRLMDLYDELENPKPRGLIDIWLEQRSKARHVMLATLVGVIIAIVLGILSLIVGIFQAWVAYEAWKHPVQG